ncbi:MAG TPA: hypothetical protein HPP87_12620 [Planctomycetes bacterium]|nr:hypothetical protein [Planctomycetota bacterium]
MNDESDPYFIKILVPKNESLWRRIAESQIVKLEIGTYRPSSAAFKGIDISVDIASKSTPERSIKTSSGLAGFLAKVPITLGYQVIENPIPENPAHAIIKGKIRRGHARTIAKACQWVIEPRFT